MYGDTLRSRQLRFAVVSQCPGRRRSRVRCLIDEEEPNGPREAEGDAGTSEGSVPGGPRAHVAYRLTLTDDSEMRRSHAP